MGSISPTIFQAEIAQNLNIILDKSMDEELILNVLQSKLAYIFSFKNVKFKSLF